MITLTPKQANTLLKIVLFANQHGGRVPTGPEFAEMLGIGTRGALARISRILERTDFSRREGKSHYINYDQLITEKESAQLCLTILEISKKSLHGRMTADDISENLNIPRIECETFIKKCCSAGYLQSISVSIKAFRAGPKIFNHFEYLNLLTKTANSAIDSDSSHV